MSETIQVRIDYDMCIVLDNQCYMYAVIMAGSRASWIKYIFCGQVC